MPAVETAAAVDALLRALADAQQPDGAWGMRPGTPAATEPTALASLALLSAAPTPAVRAAANRGLDWLVARQRADGGWPTTVEIDTSDWTSSPAVLALAIARPQVPAVRRGVRWLTARAGAHVTWRERLGALIAFAPSEDVSSVDESIPGWPWVGGTFSWVEPTSLAVLALRAAAHVARSGDVTSRIRDGENLLVDRTVPGGGWNYGNSRVLDVALDPYPDTTGWALLALRGAPSRASTAVSHGLKRLEVLMRDTRSPLSRALTILAFAAYGRSAESYGGPLAACCASAPGADGPPPADARSQALSLLALASPGTLTIR